MHRNFRPLLAALMVTTAQTAVWTMPAKAGVPGSRSQINLDAHSVALGGYDPVGYFDGGKPTHGIPTIFASYGGARYLFATPEHRRAFLKNPSKYIPEFGGFCVVGTAFAEKIDVDPITGEVVNGKLYLNNNQRALDIFNKDQSGTIAKAKSNWPTVKDKAL
jgi:hypothetical protein